MAHWQRQLLDQKRHMGISAVSVECSVELAEALLELNTHNRALSDNVVEKYAREITRGEWCITSAGVGISDRGVLLDGQHRLAAIVRAGQAAPLLVVTGLPHVSQKKMDRQFRRSLYAILKIEGIATKSKHVQTATALLRYRNSYDNSHAITDSEVEETLETHADAIASVCSEIPNKTRGWSAAVLAALTLGYELAPDLTLAFMSKVRMPTEITADNPAFRFSKWLHDPDKKKSTGRGRQQNDFQRTAYCLNAWLASRPITSVRTAPDVVLPDQPGGKEPA